VTSRTFLKVIDHCQTWKQSSSNGSARAWILRIAANELNDLFTAAKRGNTVHERWAVDNQLTRQDVDQLEHLIRGERSAELARHIDELPPGEKEALVLVYLDQLTPREAASVLQVNNVTLRARLSRGRRRLRNRLESASSDLARPLLRSVPATQLAVVKGSQS
jgi:RNA polymerase sigma-70 factor (ECF subfamily)